MSGNSVHMPSALAGSFLTLSALAGSFLTFLAQMVVGARGTSSVGSFQSGRAFTGQRALTTEAVGVAKVMKHRQ